LGWPTTASPSVLCRSVEALRCGAPRRAAPRHLNERRRVVPHGKAAPSVWIERIHTNHVRLNEIGRRVHPGGTTVSPDGSAPATAGTWSAHRACNSSSLNELHGRFCHKQKSSLARHVQYSFDAMGSDAATCSTNPGRSNRPRRQQGSHRQIAVAAQNPFATERTEL